MGHTNTALKEWAVITQALDKGQQLLILRKGGIKEQKRQFVLEKEEFLLYPTYEHQRRDLLKPQYYTQLEETMTLQSNGSVEVSNLARVNEALEITDPDKVEALSHFYICTTNYAHYRLNWRPKKPLSILLLRVFRLPQPRTLPVLERYGGCTSWVELEEPVETSGATPVLEEAEFRAKLEEIHRALGE